MFKRVIKSFIFAVASSVVFSLPAFAGTVGSASSFPYDIEFDIENCQRICYAGHPNGTVVYKDGIAITPDTSFRIVSKDSEGPSQNSVSDLSIVISMVYENDDRTGSYKETVKQYDAGSLNFQDDFRIMSDNAAASLEDRDKLYSGSLAGYEMTLYCKSKDVKKKTIYLYVCNDDDYYDYLMNAPEEPEDEDEPGESKG